MAYRLEKVTIRSSNTAEGMRAIEALWEDITSGKLPILFDSAHSFQAGISPISEYSNYASDETGEYDLSVMGVTSDFFAGLEQGVAEGAFQKYDESDGSGDIGACTQRAWERVWADQAGGKIKRSFTRDFESSVPAEYTKDGKAHCYLYIAIEK